MCKNLERTCTAIVLLIHLLFSDVPIAVAVVVKASGKRGHIVAHDDSWAAQTGKHLLRTQNVSEQNQKHFLCPGHKICVRNKIARAGKPGNICVGNNVSATMCPRLPGP